MGIENEQSQKSDTETNHYVLCPVCQNSILEGQPCFNCVEFEQEDTEQTENNQ
jgi:hypothetical protein